MRGYLLRKDMKKREIACVKIQACWRGFAARKQIKEEEDTKYHAMQNTAALKIQVFTGIVIINIFMPFTCMNYSLII